MALQTINLGTYANDGTGDDLRTAFQKVNANLIELFSTVFGCNVGSVPPTSGVEEGELWWSTVEGRLYVRYGTAWIDASPDIPTIYSMSASAITGGANLDLIGDPSSSTVKLASSTNIIVTRTDSGTITLSSPSYTGNVTGNLTGDTTGIHTGPVFGNVTGDVTGNTYGIHYGNVTGDVTGNASTVTNGVYTSGSYLDPSWITSLAGSKITGNISGNAGTVTNGVYTTSSVNALSDVDTITTPPTSGQALAWNGTSWVPQTIVAGVSKIIAGSNISINPTNGLGQVTINSTGVSDVFDLGSFQQTFDNPISYLLDQVGINFGTFTSPASFTIDGGTF